MRVPGGKLALTSIRWARSRVVGGIAVLGYHRLRRALEDPFDIGISVDDFTAHLDIIRRRARVIRLDEAVRALSERRMPSRAVVVTFDDGYADMVQEILPLLERHAMPATVFVTTGSPGRSFWWDELAAMLLEAPSLPSTLDLVIGGVPRTWALPGDGEDPANVQDARRKLLSSLAAEFRVLSGSQRDTVMSRLRAWSGCSVPDRPGDRSLTTEEIQQLAANPLIEIGAHTVSHATLTALPDDEQRAEIVQSRVRLQELTGDGITSFSYPHGAYSPSTIAAVKAAGFAAACSSVPGVVTPRADVFALPRLWVPPRSGPGFERWLDRWLVN